jgi:hypothetical protein
MVFSISLITRSLHCISPWRPGEENLPGLHISYARPSAFPPSREINEAKLVGEMEWGI